MQEIPLEDSMQIRRLDMYAFNEQINTMKVNSDGHNI